MKIYKGDGDVNKMINIENPNDKCNPNSCNWVKLEDIVIPMELRVSPICGGYEAYYFKKLEKVWLDKPKPRQGDYYETLNDNPRYIEKYWKDLMALERVNIWKR